MNIMCMLIVFLLYSLPVYELFVLADNAKVVCRDESGNAVDWYYMYKLPKDYSPNGIEKHELEGLQYLYISSATEHDGWQLSKRTINDSNSFPGQTLSLILGDKNIALVAYNDEPPDGDVNSIEGHTKGIIAANSETGFWLVHSVPKFPRIEAYDYPATGRHYGQSFLCVSLNSDQIDAVGEQQIFNEPNIYYFRIPEQLRSKFPNLVRASENKWRDKPPFWNFIQLVTRDGRKFGSFAKGKQFKKELYEDWVAPTLNADLLVESWRHGQGILPTNCTKKQHVLNIAAVRKRELSISFDSTKDHSKWCVAQDINADWICVGDINRAKHQLSRGGGTVCQLNRKIATAYRSLVADVEPCPNQNYL